MIDFSTRLDKKELLDGDDIPLSDIRQNMHELNIINTWLGGHAITIRGLKHFIKTLPANRQLHICEIGCGGGDNLLALQRWCSKKGIAVRFTGIDINPACIAVAREQCAGIAARWICSDYLLADVQTDKPDIIFNSLFCHHFSNVSINTMLLWMQQHSKLGFFINDLHRHPIAYYSILLLTRACSSSYLVKHDAPLSVARAFTKEEWLHHFNQTNIIPSRLSWQWAFRYLIIYQHA
ncbi:MAG: hypothetical protein RL172_1869 [Bacteroidota bacterium]|jgi:2-polyprenyl-3-methyl-5-hydroxy-6-metoxy-1,4-benzoquinol methylase